MDAQAEGINEADLLDLEIPDEDLADPKFAHKSVRATITAAKLEKDTREDSEHFGKISLMLGIVLGKNQPDHSELEVFAGFRIPFARFRITAGNNQAYKDICRQFALDPKRPDLSQLVDQPVIVSIKTNSYTGRDGEQKTAHNVNRVVRDLEV